MSDDAAPALARTVWAVLAAALVWHLLTLLAPPLQPPLRDSAGRDFASYHYAAKVAAAGGDPYDKARLEEVARSEGTRRRVHPYFYPPPFVLFVLWSVPLSLPVAFGVWEVFNELFLIAAGLALWRWWRPLSPWVGAVVVGVGALSYGVSYGAELGQANAFVLALILAGLWQEERRPGLAGALVGVAAMAKMSPALIVLWWILRRRWTAVAASIGCAVALSVLVLPWVSAGHQLGFYTGVLPRLGGGDYNGLTIQIGMFGNHSVPNVLHQLFPSGHNALSGAARAGSAVATFSVLGALGWLFFRPTSDPVRLAAQASTVLVAMLLVPVYTFEHHLLLALPAMILSVVGVERGLLSRRWVIPLGLALAVLAFPLPYLKQLSVRVLDGAPSVVLLGVQEAKFVALCTLGAAVASLGLSRVRERGRMQRLFLDDP